MSGVVNWTPVLRTVVVDDMWTQIRFPNNVVLPPNGRFWSSSRGGGTTSISITGVNLTAAGLRLNVVLPPDSKALFLANYGPSANM
jgi:hypothetical protein